MIHYLLAFVLAFWPHLTRYQRTEAGAIAADVLTTDATPGEALRLMNVAAMESGFSRTAHGSHGELGAFQIMPPARSYGAAEALRRMRVQGMDAYCGCTRQHPCPALVAHRVDRADLWRMAFDPPAAVLQGASAAAVATTTGGDVEHGADQ